MIRRVTLGFILIGFSFLSLHAQKVKYKDLIVLLTAKEYQQAEPFLKRYLKENTDNPNAYLYMGIVFEDKSARIDPLVYTPLLTATIDSALLFYDKAYKVIDEKELKRNDEYYESYSRRDLRTGKFVIKLSDVRLDIETRTKALRERKEYVQQLRSHLTATSTAYARAVNIYKALHEKYGSEREFYLRSDDEMMASLKSLISVFDSMSQAFDKYKHVLSVMGKVKYNQVINLQEIKDIKRDGAGEVDFLKDDLRLWDYKRWANASITVIEKEIIPMRDNLVAYDVEINKLRDKLKADSISVKSDLTKLVSKMLSDQLRKYDPDPMPLAVFSMKIAELEFASNVILNKPVRDSANIKSRLKAVKDEIGDLYRMDSISVNLLKRNYSEEEKDYGHFISKAYGTTTVLKSLISSTGEFAKREVAKREVLINKLTQSLKWIVSGTDSIPLFTDSNRDLKFKPLLIEQDKYTLGLVFQDTLATGYFYTITPSHAPDIKISFPVDQANFSKRSLPLMKCLATTDGSGHIYFGLIVSTQKAGDKFPVTIAKIYRSDGLSWSNNYSFDQLPSEISLNNETGELSVKLSSPDGSNKIIMIDKTGKLIP